MMAKRKALSKKIRFEVFKRDSFTCQYCGEKAPDVILHIDHITPVAEGGTNDILNLVTSCKGCNHGKGARTLDDNSVIIKQRQQLDDLEERRGQLEMMVQWRKALEEINSQEIAAVADIFECKNWTVSDVGKRKIKSWIKRYTFKDVLKAATTSVSQYYEYDGDDVTGKSWSKAFDYTPRIISMERYQKDNPDAKELYYYRGILRNRFPSCNESIALRYLFNARNAGARMDGLRDLCKHADSWNDFTFAIEEFLGREEHDA